MRSRVDDIRKRIEKQKKERARLARNIENRVLWAEDEERYGFNKMDSFEGDFGEGGHPLFKKEWFFFKVLASICLVLIVAIMFRNESTKLAPIRAFVQETMNQDFQFAAVSDWYETTFGEPLAFLPFTKEKDTDQAEKTPSINQTEYALPASGTILEKFESDGQKITIQTGSGASVESMNEGLVRFVGKKEGFGKTVIVQHADKSESWYGNLDDINVNLYEYIEKGTKVGTASNSEDNTKGSFYFGIKQGENFIDPIQVIQFD